MEPEKFVIHLEWMLVSLFCLHTGYTPKAVQRKIEDGKWLEGRMYMRAPDGHITINLQEYYRWVNGTGMTVEKHDRRVRRAERRRTKLAT